jgi:hypothetical protein
MSGNQTKSGRFPELLQARCPTALPHLIESVAQRQCMTPSEYIRRSVFERLKADGIDPGLLDAAPNCNDTGAGGSNDSGD